MLQVLDKYFSQNCVAKRRHGAMQKYDIKNGHKDVWKKRKKETKNVNKR